MVVDFAPLIACIIGPWGWSYNTLMATKECVIAIPTIDLLEKVVEIGNCSGQDVDKFARFGLTSLPAKDVQAPLIAKCLANIECRVIDTTLTDKYGFIHPRGCEGVDRPQPQRAQDMPCQRRRNFRS